MNRIDRLTAILIHLQSKRVVRAQDLADRFQISLRTVYRDIRALEEAGVPIGAEAGVGYFLDGYHLPPVMFTNAEASALVFGAKLMAKLTDESLREPFETALYKVKSVLKGAEKEHLDALEPMIGVSGYVSPDPFTEPVLNQLQTACVQQQVLTLDYQTPYDDQATTRLVEPIGLYHYSAYWHLIAFCRLRQDYRDFRIDRIRHLVVMPQLFSRKSLLSLQDYLARFTQEQALTEVVVWVTRDMARFTHQQRCQFGFLSEERQGERVKMVFLTQYPEGLGRWLMMFGQTATIEQPASLRAAMLTYADEVRVQYASPDGHGVAG